MTLGNIFKILNLTFINDITDNDKLKLIIIVTFVVFYASIYFYNMVFSISFWLRPQEYFETNLLFQLIFLSYVSLILPHMVMDLKLALATNSLIIFLAVNYKILFPYIITFLNYIGLIRPLILY